MLQYCFIIRDSNIVWEIRSSGAKILFICSNFFTEDSTIEYFCSGEYSPGCEAGISPLADDIDWSLCDPELKKLFDGIAPTTDLITDKDKNGFTVKAWGSDERSDNFIYGQL